MGIDWNQHKREKQEIKLKYLELLKERFRGKDFNLREEVTTWAIDNFKELKIPKKQFAGTFDHSKNGLFIKENGVLVTKKAIKSEALKNGISEIEYLDTIVSIIQN